MLTCMSVCCGSGATLGGSLGESDDLSVSPEGDFFFLRKKDIVTVIRPKVILTV